MTPCTRQDNPKQVCAEGNNANDALYWKIPLVKSHLLVTSVIAHNKEFRMFMQSTQSTNIISTHTPVANPTFYRKGWDKTRKFITKKLNSYPLKWNKGRTNIWLTHFNIFQIKFGQPPTFNVTMETKYYSYISNSFQTPSLPLGGVQWCVPYEVCNNKYSIWLQTNLKMTKPDALSSRIGVDMLQKIAT